MNLDLLIRKYNGIVYFFWGSLLLTILIVCSCKRAQSVVEEDKKKYPLISAERPIGSVCYPDDSASVKRRRFHPMGPTGGWGSTAQMDTQRTKDLDKNVFSRIGPDLAGYVRFPVRGRLIMRSYDDVYGDVHCGWSPVSVEYTPQPQHVYVLFSHCGMGDGGLDQVHELCWFPAGQEKGEIVYSSAHNIDNELKPYELFVPKHIGVVAGPGQRQHFYFHFHEADKIFDSLLAAGEMERARTLISENINNLKHLSPAVDGSTQKPISSMRFHRDTIVKLLLLKAGVDLFNSSAEQALSNAKDVLSLEPVFPNPTDYAKDLIDLYIWAVNRVQGVNMPLPIIPDEANRVNGHDPRLIVRILSDSKMTERNMNKNMQTKFRVDVDGRSL